MFSDENKQLYIINGYKFSFQTFLNDNVQRWLCSKRLCKFDIKSNENSEIIFSALYYNHDKDDKN